jgi:hypothetical protein
MFSFLLHISMTVALHQQSRGKFESCLFAVSLLYCTKVFLITCHVAEFAKESLLFHSWCVSKVILSMRNKRSTAIFGYSCHPPEGYIAPDVRKKRSNLLKKYIFFK